MVAPIYEYLVLGSSLKPLEERWTLRLSVDIMAEISTAIMVHTSKFHVPRMRGSALRYVVVS